LCYTLLFRETETGSAEAQLARDSGTNDAVDYGPCVFACLLGGEGVLLRLCSSQHARHCCHASQNLVVISYGVLFLDDALQADHNEIDMSLASSFSAQDLFFVFPDPQKKLHKIEKRRVLRLMSTSHGRIVEIVEILGCSISSLRRRRAKVERKVARKSGSGRFAELAPRQRDELKTILLQGAQASGDATDRWTSRIVADLIRKKRGVEYCLCNARKILCDLGLSFQGLRFLPHRASSS